MLSFYRTVPNTDKSRNSRRDSLLETYALTDAVVAEDSEAAAAVFEFEQL